MGARQEKRSVFHLENVDVSQRWAQNGKRLTMQIVNQLSQSTWREFVLAHPQASIFHTPEMAQVFARAKGYIPHMWAAVDDDGAPLVLFPPVEMTLLGGPFKRLTTRAILYGGVLCAPDLAGQTALTTLLQVYRRRMGGKVLFTELRNLVDLGDLQSTLVGNGFAYEEHLNYLIDLARPVDAIMQDIGARTRKNIRRALRDERMQVIEASQREQVSICYALLRKTYQAAQVPLADRSLFDAAFDVLYPRGMVKFLLVKVGNAYAAGSVELVFKDTIYGWYGGLDRVFSRYNPNELLTWYILEWGARNGFKVYDFGGAGKPNEEYGVRDFKSKFGGELVCFGRNTCVHAPLLLRLSQWGYPLYQKMVAAYMV
jgi:serine/alanine adding enzyme